ncbi:MAG: TerB family tellurite resistance protein [Planctomycetota bacterium]
MSSSLPGYPCPYCHDRELETVSTAPYVRGLIAAYLVGSKSFIGCTSCVRKKMFGEAGLSALIGWFSVVAFILNPIFIVYNVIRACLIGENKKAVAKKLKQLGLPDNPQVVDIQSVGFALAASMILADGQVEEAELLAAEKAGDEVFGEFDEAALRMVVMHGKDLPPVEDLASMLKDALDDDQKDKVMVYLAEIAMADGNVAPEERAMLERVGKSLGIATAA